MFLDPRWDLKPTGIAEEFDRACELWARGIPYSEVTKVGSGNNIRGGDARYLSQYPYSQHYSIQSHSNPC